MPFFESDALAGLRCDGLRGSRLRTGGGDKVSEVVDCLVLSNAKSKRTNSTQSCAELGTDSVTGPDVLVRERNFQVACGTFFV